MCLLSLRHPLLYLRPCGDYVADPGENRVLCRYSYSRALSHSSQCHVEKASVRGFWRNEHETRWRHQDGCGGGTSLEPRNQGHRHCGMCQRRARDADGICTKLRRKTSCRTAAKRVLGVAQVVDDLAVKLPPCDALSDAEIARNAMAALKIDLPLCWEAIQLVVEQGEVRLEGIVTGIFSAKKRNRQCASSAAS